RSFFSGGGLGSSGGFSFSLACGSGSGVGLGDPRSACGLSAADCGADSLSDLNPVTTAATPATLMNKPATIAAFQPRPLTGPAALRCATKTCRQKLQRSGWSAQVGAIRKDWRQRGQVMVTTFLTCYHLHMATTTPSVTFWGAAQSVSGSMHLIEAGK